MRRALCQLSWAPLQRWGRIKHFLKKYESKIEEHVESGGVEAEEQKTSEEEQKKSGDVCLGWAKKGGRGEGWYKHGAHMGRRLGCVGAMTKFVRQSKVLGLYSGEIIGYQGVPNLQEFDMGVFEDELKLLVDLGPLQTFLNVQPSQHFPSCQKHKSHSFL